MCRASVKASWNHDTRGVFLVGGGAALAGRLCGVDRRRRFKKRITHIEFGSHVRGAVRAGSSRRWRRQRGRPGRGFARDATSRPARSRSPHLPRPPGCGLKSPIIALGCPPKRWRGPLTAPPCDVRLALIRTSGKVWRGGKTICCAGLGAGLAARLARRSATTRWPHVINQDAVNSRHVRRNHTQGAGDSKQRTTNRTMGLSNWAGFLFRP